MAIMEGSNPVEKWQAAFGPAYKANLYVWPFVQGANFAFVPLDLRVLVVNVVSLGEFRIPEFVNFCRVLTNKRLELLP